MRSLHLWPIFPTNLEAPIARSLSIQFILQASIQSLELVDHLEKLVSQTLQGVHLKEEIAVISKELEKFMLFSLENPFSQKGSALDKLCFYSEILLQASNISGEEISMSLEEMRNLILRTKGKIIPWKKETFSSVESILSHFSTLFSSLRQKLADFFTKFFPFLWEARSDENVLVYLIENREKLNDLLGLRTIEHLLQKLFPSGHAQLRAVICEGYTRRGFTSFYTQIEPRIDALEWETR